MCVFFFLGGGGPCQLRDTPGESDGQALSPRVGADVQSFHARPREITPEIGAWIDHGFC